jgi:hypothetical protein
LQHVNPNHAGASSATWREFAGDRIAVKQRLPNSAGTALDEEEAGSKAFLPQPVSILCRHQSQRWVAAGEERTTMDPQTPVQRRLVRRLWARRDTGVVVCRTLKSQPASGNPSRVLPLELNAAHKAIRGWLFFALSLKMCPQFVAHSVVEQPDGSLMDTSERFVADLSIHQTPK